jgi:uncharacterized phiE125 gp8 family phage protein
MRPYSFTTITAPATEPISLVTAKAHLRVEIDDDDTLITSLIKSARQYAETYCKRKMITQTVEAKYPAWPTGTGGFWLPSPPLISVTGVYYYDENGTEQTLSGAVYGLDTSSEPGQVFLDPSQAWPSIQSGRELPIRVRYVAGYADAASVPDSIKEAILLMVGLWYSQRSPVVTGTIIAEVPMTAHALLGINACDWGW